MSDNLPTRLEQQVLLQKDRHEYEIAKLNIEKTCENNAMWAAHWYKMRLLAYGFTGLIFVLILAFCVLAMYLGKDAIAMEIVKAGIFLSAGGGVGFALGYRKGKNPGPE